jgi:hypothetical protein
MISRVTGEIDFRDGLRIIPHAPLTPEFIQDSRDFIVPGWSGHDLGLHDSDQGAFEVTAISDPQSRVQLVLVSHFYHSDTPSDAERRAFHEGVISTDLGGQQEFSWGHVFCRRDPATNKDSLIVAYAPGPHVPMERDPLLHYLQAHEPKPGNA